MRSEKVDSIPFMFLVQLAMSFLLVGFTVTLIIDRYGPVLSILLGCLIGLLVTVNISQALFAFHTMLHRLVHGLPVQVASPLHYWPLHTLFRLTETFDRQRRTHTEAQQAVPYADQFTQQIIKVAAQEERNRLARDLHDSIKQQIFSITMSAAAVKARWERDQERARTLVDDIERIAREAHVEMQALLQQLRPDALENSGLLESLRLQCQALAYRTGVKVESELGKLPAEEQLLPGAQEMIFRIVQEAFANIARHARASNVWLALYQQQQNLLVEIGDDGQGFDLSTTRQPDETGGMGLKNVYERVHALNGTIQLWSMVGRGTTLHIAIPFMKRAQKSQQLEEIDAGTSVVAKRTRLVTSTGWRLLDLAFACILLCLPGEITYPILGACLTLAGIAWIIALHQRAIVAISTGYTHEEHLLLLADGYAFLSGIIASGMFLVGYLRYSWLHSPLALVGVVLVLICAGLYQLNMQRYAQRVSVTVLRRELHFKLQKLAINVFAWLIAVSIAYIFGVLKPDISFVSSQWIRDASILLCLLWLIVNIAEGLQTLRWQQIVVRRVH